MGEVGMMSTQGLDRCLVIKMALVIIHQALLNATMYREAGVRPQVF